MARSLTLQLAGATEAAAPAPVPSRPDPPVLTREESVLEELAAEREFLARKLQTESAESARLFQENRRLQERVQQLEESASRLIDTSSMYKWVGLRLLRRCPDPRGRCQTGSEISAFSLSQGQDPRAGGQGPRPRGSAASGGRAERPAGGPYQPARVGADHAPGTAGRHRGQGGSNATKVHGEDPAAGMRPAASCQMILALSLLPSSPRLLPRPSLAQPRPLAAGVQTSSSSKRRSRARRSGASSRLRPGSRAMRPQAPAGRPPGPSQGSGGRGRLPGRLQLG